MSADSQDDLQAWYAVINHGLDIANEDLSSGVIKTYRLTYESVEILHALFNKNAAKNTWKMDAGTLKSFVEYFGASTEQLDVSSNNGRTTFMSYTEKVMNGRGLTLFPNVS